ncbi:hypothetical protein OV090_40990 [Nannocystis sp. RBIL2]|uniref:SMODS domain-containing nucleotidyltransferase n=1 Tax=Nannocystis sp. RBIL2 TaxID=2996788 RepID=UPI002271843C|nr:hypothetical protein [Nannocystis sp. RBIL2]MCY1071191.1 hypothetical protein [Nannocystis sp. RBIL2]
MSTLPSRFRTFLSLIRPSQVQLRKLRAAHLLLSRHLRHSPELQPYFVSTFLQGSYRRSTALGALGDHSGSDVDLVLVTNLDPERHDPESVLKLLRPLIRRHGPTWRVQERSFRLSDGDISLDLVVASAPTQVDLAYLRAEAAAEPLDDNDLPSAGEQNAWKLQPLWIPDRGAKSWRRTCIGSA